MSAAFCNERWGRDPNPGEFGGLDLCEVPGVSKKISVYFGCLPKTTCAAPLRAVMRFLHRRGRFTDTNAHLLARSPESTVELLGPLAMRKSLLLELSAFSS